MSVEVAEDQVDVLFVAKHDVIEEFQTELSELNRPASHFFDLLSLVFRDAFGQPAGDGRAGMNLSSANDLHHIMSELARLNDLAAGLETDLVNYAQNVALRHRCIGTHHKIGSAEGVEMSGVIGKVERAVK